VCGRFFAIQQGIQALNHDGALPPDLENVVQDSNQGDIDAIHGADFWPVDLIHVQLGARIQLGPNLVLHRQQLQAQLDLRQVEPTRVGNENDLEKGKFALGAQVDDDLNGFVEIGAESRFAVATESHRLEG